MDRGGSWWVVVALGLRIVMDRRANRGGGCVEILFFFFFWGLCGGYFLWIWLSVVVFRGLNFVFFPLWWLFFVVVVVVGGGFGDLSCGFSCGCDLLGLI